MQTVRISCGTKHARSRSNRRRNAVTDRIVSVGLLTQRDLDVLGSSFTRHFPVPRDDTFADLIRRLDHVEAIPQRERNERN